MGLDLVTYLRTEFVSAAIITNQTPRSANVCLQIGTEDGRGVQFVPRTIKTFITSTIAEENTSSPSKNNNRNNFFNFFNNNDNDNNNINDNTNEKKTELSVSMRRQLKQSKQRRSLDMELIYSDQPADNLFETEDQSVDVVISLQAAARLSECGMDWKKSVCEASRVLKPGGRFLFVEQTTLEGEKGPENFVNYVQNLGYIVKSKSSDDNDLTEEEGGEVLPVFSEVGLDDVDLVLVPHVAGVAVKAGNVGLTKEEVNKRDKRAKDDASVDLALSVFDRGNKATRRKRKKKKKNKDGEEGNDA